MKLDLNSLFLVATVVGGMAAWAWWMIKLSNLENGEVARVPFHHFLPGAYWINGLIDIVLKAVN
jgi:hypothetical protein